MSKRVKCKECANSGCWALPVKVSVSNYDYAKRCLHMARTTLVCNETMKTKSMDHEQYCKKYLKQDASDIATYIDELTKLEDKIRNYEEESGTGKEA